MKPILEIQNISKKFRIRGQVSPYLTLRESLMSIGKKSIIRKDEFWALKDINFNVYPGDSIGIIGRNGAGKSTLLKILSRITPPTKGQIICRGRVASLLEVGTGFHMELTGRENIFLNGSILGLRKEEIKAKFDEIIDFSGVEKFLDTPLKHYSSGMQLRLAFAVAAHLEPEILVIDEVLAVGDAEFQKKCLNKMDEVTKQGRTVLFVSHNMAAVKNLCSKGVLLNEGKVIKNDKINFVIDYYLKDILPSLYKHSALINRTDRTGTGLVKFTDFRVEDLNGNILNVVMSGTTIKLIFSYQCADTQKANNVDVGFSLHTHAGDTLAVNYCSYYNKNYNNLIEKGEFIFIINNLHLSKGIYKIGARIVVNNEEADWPRNFVAELNIEDGDYYKTGKSGFVNAPVLIEGKWL
ncbi:MAG: ABC transporter ATP-binding protein [Bacteroidales bacterium]|nr:ABC transporter ATP-binding protein [Bacteroidales bacterium]